MAEAMDPARYSTIDELLGAAGWGGESATPWKAGHELVYRGTGGIHSLGSRHVTVAGDALHIGVEGDRGMRVDGDMNVRASGDWVLSNQDARGDGMERLHVKGSMNWTAHERLIMGNGRIERIWHGAVARVAGMEGVICAGAWHRGYYGGSASLVAIKSNELYGGALRTAAVRVTVAGIGYRSSDRATWYMGSLLRSTHTTLETLVGSASGTEQSKSARMKALAGKIASVLFMPGAIIFGVLSMVPMLLYAFVSWLDTKYFAAPVKPPATLPRVRTRTVAGNAVEVRTSEIVL